MSINEHPSQASRSFIEEARRAQIVASAIEVIAEHGYAAATMDRIARHARISRSLINYHFAGRDDLVGQLVLDVFGRGAAVMVPAVEAAQSPRDKLTAYITSNLRFIAENRSAIVALVRAMAAVDMAEGLPGLDPDAEDQGLAYLRQILSDGQAVGEFDAFDVRQMAVSIRNVIDGVSTQLAADRGLDLAALTYEITTLFHRATRATGERP